MAATRDSLVRLLRQMIDEGGTEMHFKVPAPPLMRQDGRLVPTRMAVLRPADVQVLVQHLCELGNRQVVVSQLQDVEFAFGINGMGRFHVSLYRQRGSLGACVRRIPIEPPTLVDVGLGIDTARLVGRPGLTLAAGPMRQDVLHAMVSEYNANLRGHAVVLESPLHYLHRDATAAVVQREVGVDVASYADGVRHAVRLGADLLVVGELDTPDAVEATLTAAESGLAVLAGVGAPESELAFWWITRQFFGEHRLVVERRLELVHQATVVHPGARAAHPHAALRAI